MISAQYKELLTQYAFNNPTWGCGGARHRETVLELIDSYDCKSVMDFGCGRGTLGNTVMGRDRHHAPAAVEWCDYDPAFPGKQKPRTSDLIVCTHVLEHVEPDVLDITITELVVLARKAIYVAVPSGPAKAILPDGRNAHLTQRPGAWWTKKFKQAGTVRVMDSTRGGETRFVVECG